MSTPIIISGTTGEFSERRYCQFWGPFKIAGRERDECLAGMSDTGGLTINPECPREWLTQVWAAYTIILTGGIPEATHTVVWGFGRPTFTAIEPAVDVDQQAFDLGALSGEMS